MDLNKHISENFLNKEKSQRASKLYKAESSLLLLTWSPAQYIKTYKKITALQREIHFPSANVQTTAAPISYNFIKCY